MSNIPLSDNVPDPNPEPRVLREIPLLSQKSDNNIQNLDLAIANSPIPTKNIPDFPKSPYQNSSLSFSQLSQEVRRELIRPRPLNRKSSNTPSRMSERQGENDVLSGRPPSGMSGGIRWDSKKRGVKRISSRSALSPGKSALTNISRSLARAEDSSVDTGSYSYSGLHYIHQMYQDIGENGSRIAGSISGTPYRNKKRSLASKVKDTYYRLLRKRFKRRNSYVQPDTQEFDQQIETIKENVHIPNDERIADLKLEEMTNLEKVEKYKDRFPFLEGRKAFMRILCRISITSNFIIMHPLFDAFIILVIIVNSVFLALDDPTSQTDMLSKVDNYFLGIYTAEMLLKIFGMGFILPRQSYLRDPWNVLDFAIVVTSYLTIALSSVNLNLRALRSLRVLRPLKTISNIEGLRIIVLTLLAALKPLLETLFILFFLFLVFAIAGLQLFAGSLKKRCFSLDGGIPLYNADGNDNSFQQYCSSDSDCGTVNSVEYICGKMIANPNYGAMNFDSIGSSLLFTFQTVTMEGWSDIMRDLQRTFSPLAPIFFIILILIGGFVLLNLTLAVIKAEFTAHSHMSIRSRRLKKPTYDERLIKKLDENKIDVIQLLHRYQTGETLYRKYQFKKDQLIALENSKRKLLRSKTSQITPGPSASRQRRNAISSNTIIGDMRPFVKIKGVLGKLKALFTSKSKFGRFSKINSLNHDTRTELPASLQELDTLNHLDRDTFRRKGKINSSKIVPHDSSKDSLTGHASLDSLPGTKRIFTPISNKFRSFFSKLNTLDHKVTMEPSSPSNVPEHQFTPRDSVEATQNNENTPDQTNVQIYKQTRGFGDLRIKITEANTPKKQQGKSPDENDPYQSSAAHPFPSSVPSVIEEELSEASPSKTFDSGSAITATKKSIFPARVVGRRRQLRFGNSPIRPIPSERVLVEQEENNKVELINIAGIRNKRNLPRNVPIRPQQKIEEARETEQELLLEEQVDDLMDDDQWFLESLKDQENEGKTIGNKDKQRAALLKKINQIKGLTDFQRRSLIYQPPSGISGMRNSNKFSSAIGSEDFEGNFSRNSQSRKGGSVRNSSKGFLEDSDFLDKKKRNSNQNSRISRGSYGSYGSRGSGSRASQKSDKRALRAKKKATLKRGMTIKEEDDAIKEENEEDEEIGAKRNEVQEEEIEDPIMSEEDVIELEEQEKHMVLDLRRLKAEPVYGKEYDSYSLNDVLPSKKLNEKKRQEEEDKRRLRENKMEIVHQVTRKEELAAIERNQKKAEEMKKEVTALAMRFSEKAKEARRQKKEEKAFDAEINAALENMRSKNNSKSSLGSWTKKFAFRKATIKGPGSELSVTNRQLSNGTQKSNAKKIKGEPKEEEEELTQGQMKDFFFLLRKIQTPFNNEKENEESEEFQKKMKVFDFESDYTKIRRKDLEENRIVLSNWSGNIVLNNTYNEFPADKVKKALNLQDWDIWRPGFFGVIHALQRKAKAFSLTSVFNTIIMLSVFLNTIILCCNGLVTNASVNSTFNDFNTAFTIIFALEMAIKIFGLGLVSNSPIIVLSFLKIEYARDPFNLCDAVIVVLSIVETIIDAGKNSASTAFRAVRLFRTLRVLRVTKLLRALSFMKIILGVILRSLKRCVYILTLLFLLIFIYTCLGMQIFGGQTDFADNVGQDRIRQNFNTFTDSFMTVFQVMTVENWNDILTVLYRSPVSNFISILYLVSWIFIGNYIFLNLFLALLLDEFTGEEVEEELEELEAEEEEAPIDKQISNMTRKSSALSKKTLSRDNSNLRSASSLNSQTFSLTSFDEESVYNEDEVHELYKALPCASALYLFPKEHPTRRLCFRISRHRYFEYGILFVIFLNCIKLILDTYIPNGNTTLTNVSDVFNYIFVAIFVIEALIKIFSLGFVFDKGSYLRDGWNLLDFVILVTSLIDIFTQSDSLSFFRVFRMLRALRPLRFISHNQNMRIVVNALLESMGPILNVLIVVVIIWLMFAILAVNLVGDQFGYCSNLPTQELYYGISESQCIKEGYIWKDFNANFNNVFQGILTLFILSTQEDWPDILFHMSDSNSADVGPIENNNRTLANLFFVFFMFIGTYFLVNLFIGVIFLNFDRAQKREEFRHKFLTPHQRKWIAVQRLIVFTQPNLTVVEPKAKWMKPFFKLITHDYFEYFMMGSIVLNVITMALTYDDSSTGYSNALTYVNYVFTAIFTGEMILKHLALGFYKYWSSRWNKFDAFVVIASLIEIIFSALSTSVISFLRAGPQIVRIFRVLRVSRLFKLIKRFTGLRKLINTLVFSLPSLLNVGGLLLLVYFIFAILATFIFKDIAGGDIIDDKLNFQNFLNSFVALFRTSTGEDWWYVMFDTIYPTSCVDGVSSCGTKGGFAFWLIYILLIQFIFLNLFILIVIQQFEEYHLDPNNPVNKFREKLKLEFNPTWQILSAKHGGFKIHEKQLTPFFMSLSPPLGFRNLDMTKTEIALEITSMHLTTNSEGMVFYNDVLYACMKRVYGNEDLVGVPKYLVKQEVRVRRKLDQLKRKLQFKRSGSSLTPSNTPSFNQVGSVNPIAQVLFMGMTMKAWLNYSKRVGEKMKAAQENGIEYVYSDTDQDDYEDEYESPQSSSSESSVDEVHDVYKEDQERNDEIISEEDSEDAESKDLGSEDERPSYQRRSHTKPSLRLSKAQNKSQDYTFVVHKENPVDTQGDEIESADRFLHITKLTRKTPSYMVSPPKKEREEDQVESVWGGSPGGINASPFKAEAGRIGSTKSIFDFWDAAEKLSNISPMSRRYSVNTNRDEFGAFDPQENPSSSNPSNPSNPSTNLRIPTKEMLDSNFLAPPVLKKGMSGPLGVQGNRAQATEMYEKAGKDLLNIPLSLSRINSNNRGDNTTPKSGSSLK